MAVPISLMGGLIGLGGAEFRLPVLAGMLGYLPRQAVPLNLAVSVITVSVALLTRSQTLPVDQLAAFLPVLLSLVVSAMAAAFWGAGWAARVSNEALKRVILVVLLAIGLALIVEAFLPGESDGFIPNLASWQILSGLSFGIVIGLFSSVLGVAGGELIIPTLVYAYGADIKLAGTASLIVSLPIMLAGILRFAHRGGYAQRQDLYETVAPMGVGSVIGAVLGGLLVGLAPARTLKLILGGILCYSAWRAFE